MKNYNILGFLILAVLMTTAKVNASHNDKPTNPTKKGETIKNYNPTFYFEYNPILEEVILTCKNNEYKAEIYDNDGTIVKQVLIKKDSTTRVSLLGLKHGKYFLRYIGKNILGNSSKILYIN